MGSPSTLSMPKKKIYKAIRKSAFMAFKHCNKQFEYFYNDPKYWDYGNTKDEPDIKKRRGNEFHAATEVFFDKIATAQVDDTINKFRDAGVKNISIASCAPPVISPNIYGIDISSKEELIMCKAKKENTTVAKLLGVDEVFYGDLNLILIELLKLNPKLNDFEYSMFI